MHRRKSVNKCLNQPRAGKNSSSSCNGNFFVKWESCPNKTLYGNHCKFAYILGHCGVISLPNVTLWPLSNGNEQTQCLTHYEIDSTPLRYLSIIFFSLTLLTVRNLIHDFSDILQSSTVNIANQNTPSIISALTIQ